MHVDLVQDSDLLADIGPEWRRLEQEGDVPYYVRHHFVSAWWHAHAEQENLALTTLVLRDNPGGRVLGIAPLATATGRRGRQVRFATHGDYLDFLLDPQAKVDTVCKGLMAALEDLPWDSVRLGNIPAGAPLAGHLLKGPYNSRFTLHVENPFIDLRRYSDFAEYTAEQMPSHTRKQRRRLLDQHDLSFRVVVGDEDGLFDRIAEVHRAERDFLRARGRTERYSLFDDDARAEHYRTIFTTTDDAVTFVLEGAGGSLAGYRTTFRDGRRLLSWNSAYHPDFAAYRVGNVLLHDMLELLFRTDDVDILDLGAGRYEWKFGWTPEFTSTYVLRLRREKQEGGPAAPDERPGRGGSGRPAGSRAASLPMPPSPPRVAPEERRTVYVVSPHPDDEVLRTAGYVTWSRTRRDQRYVLVAVTDGGSSSLSRRVGWTREQEQSYRRAEQAVAWSAMTGGEGEVVRLGLPDGALTPETVVGAVRTTLPELLGSRVEVVVASHPDDYHPDHLAVAQAFRELAPQRLSFSLSPLMDPPVDPRHLVRQVAPPPELLAAVQLAHDAYAGFGQRSVREEFAALAEQGFRSRITSPDQRPTAAPGPLAGPRHRVLVLGVRPEVLPRADAGTALRSPARDLLRAAGNAVERAVEDPSLLPLVADPPRGRRAWARRLRDDLLSRLVPARRSPAADWARTLAASSRARVLIGDADSLISMDPVTDEALRLLPALVGGRPVVTSDRAGAVLDAVHDADVLLDELTDAERAREVAEDVDLDALLDEWGRRAAAVGPVLTTDRHLLAAWSGARERVVELYGPGRGRLIVSRVLELLP